MRDYKTMISQLLHASFDQCQEDVKNVLRNNELEYDTIRLNSEKISDTSFNYAEWLEQDNNKNTNLLPVSSMLDEQLQYLYNAFHYIEMSPKKAEEHEKTYIIDRKKFIKPNIEKYLRNTQYPVINQNLGFINQVFDFWSLKSRQLAGIKNIGLSNNLCPKDLSIYFINGAPGIGKTALLNYLFSVNAKRLISDKVIWIRIDLNDPRDMQLGLRCRLYSKFLSIFAKHYVYPEHYPFNGSFMSDLKENLEKDIFKTFTKSEMLFIVDQYINFIIHLAELENMGRRPNVIIEAENFNIPKQYLLYLIERTINFIQSEYKFGYIFMYDGLDSVTLDAIQYDQYERWLNEILDIVNNRGNRFSAVNIITMRDYSFIDFFVTRFQNKDNVTEEYVFMHVVQKSLYEIVQKKIVLAVQSFVNDKKKIPSEKVRLWHIKNNIIDAINMCIRGMPAEEFSEKFVSNNAITRKDYDLLYTICNNNYRAIMRFFRQLLLMLSSVFGKDTYRILSGDYGYKNTLNKFERKKWAIYRVLIFGDCGERAYLNRIGYDFNGDVRIQTKHSSIIPNIFNYKNIADNIHDNKFPRLFLKIRALQIIYSKPEKKISIFNLINKLAIVYDCSDQSIRSDIREMIYTGLIYPDIKEFEFILKDDQLADYPVVATRQSHYLIEKMISESIYYEIIVDDTPIDRSIAQLMKPVHRYESYMSLSKYIIVKTRCILHFIFYLKQIELEEKKLWDQYETELGEFKPVMTDLVIRNIFDSISAYLHNHIVNLPNEKEFVDRFCKHMQIYNKFSK